MLFLLLSDETYRSTLSDPRSKTPFGSHNSNVVETQPQIYKHIASWMLQHSNDTTKLPVLSSLRDNTWLNYSKNELFIWKDLPSHFVSEVLERLDNKFSYDRNNNYGDLGAPVHLPDSLVKGAKNKMSLHQLNVVASDIMSLNRRLKEMRNSR